MFSVERAHRVSACPPPPGANPHLFIFKLLIDNSKVSLFPDFSTEPQKWRAQFNDVKRHLRSLELKYAMLYPARFGAKAKGEVHLFEKPILAMQWQDRE